jgi:MFS family permease
MNIIERIKQKTGLSGYQRGLWAAMGVQAIRSTGYSISFTYLPLYLYNQRHISMTLVGTLILVSGIVSGLSQVLGGLLADRLGHRKLFIVVQLIETTLFALLAVLIGTNSSVWLIFLSSAAVTIMGGLSAPAISAIVADISQRNRLAESYGLMAIGGNLGWAIGPLTGGYLQSLTSYAWIFATGAVVTSISLAASPYLPRDVILKSKEILTKKKLGLSLLDSNLLIFCGICMLFYLEMAQWGSTLSVFTVDRIGFTPEQYGLLMSISGLLIIIFQYPLSRWINRLGYRRTLYLGSLLYGIGFLSFSWVKSFIPAIGSIVILVTGEMLFIPASYAVISKISQPADRAKNMGILGLCATVGSSFGPLLGGFLLDKFTVSPMLIWGPVALPAFIAAIGFILWRGYSKTE